MKARVFFWNFLDLYKLHFNFPDTKKWFFLGFTTVAGPLSVANAATACTDCTEIIPDLISFGTHLLTDFQN